MATTGGDGGKAGNGTAQQWLIAFSLLTNRDKIILNKLTLWEAGQWTLIFVPIYVLVSLDFIEFFIRGTLAVMLIILGFRFIHVPTNGLVGTEWGWVWLRYKLEERSGRHYTEPATEDEAGGSSAALNTVIAHGGIGRPIYRIEPGTPTAPKTTDNVEVENKDEQNTLSMPTRIGQIEVAQAQANPKLPFAAPPPVTLAPTANDFNYLADLDLD